VNPDLRTRYDAEVRQRIDPPPGRRRDDDGTLVTIVGPTAHELDHMVAASRLTAATAEAVIEELVTRAKRERHGVQWNVYDHDEPADLAARLVRHGFVAQPVENVMALPSAEAARLPTGAPAVEVRRVMHERELDDLVAIQEEVWGPGHTEWLLAWWKPALRGEGNPIGIFLARVEGERAGSAWVTLPRGGAFAGLFGGTVRAPFRRRGIHRALVAARARAAEAAGIPWLVVDANSQSAPLLARLGFATFARRTELVLAPP